MKKTLFFFLFQALFICLSCSQEPIREEADRGTIVTHGSKSSGEKLKEVDQKLFSTFKFKSPSASISGYTFDYDNLENREHFKKSPLLYQKRHEETNIRTVNELGKRMILVLLYLLEKEYYLVPCAPYNGGDSDLIRVRKVSEPAFPAKIMKAEGKIINQAEILKQIPNSEDIKIIVELKISEVQKFDIKKGTQNRSWGFSEKLPVDITIRYSYDWVRRDYDGILVPDKKSILISDNSSLNLYQAKSDNFPCIPLFPDMSDVLSKLKTDERAMHDFSKSAKLYGYDLLEFLENQN